MVSKLSVLVIFSAALLTIVQVSFSELTIQYQKLPKKNVLYMYIRLGTLTSVVQFPKRNTSPTAATRGSLIARAFTAAGQTSTPPT